MCFISCRFVFTLLSLRTFGIEQPKLWGTTILSKVIKSATSMTFSVILGLSITLLHMIWLLLLVEFVFIRHVLWVTRTGSPEPFIILYTMNLRKRCCTRRMLMMVLH
jgi:hypothetical protein